MIIDSSAVCIAHFGSQDNPSSIYVVNLKVIGTGALQPATSSPMNIQNSPTLKNGLWKLSGGAPTTWGSWLILEGRAPDGERSKAMRLRLSSNK